MDLELYLKDYYYNLYPSDLIIKWLLYAKKEVKEYLANREFAFILKDDFHIRYLSFIDANEFKERLRKCVPYKIDIGAVYNRPPRDRKIAGDFIACERELVFDIDLTDYDSIRNCCKEANVCGKCWRWIIIAVFVLENLLSEHFNFKHLLWVFSGRRGIHCWVADKKARLLNGRARDAIAKYMTFDKEGTAISKKRVHPFIEHSYKKIMQSGQFDHLIAEQGWFDSPEQWNSVLNLCADKNLAETLNREFTMLKTSELRWESLKLRFDEVERRKAGEAKLPPMPSDAAKNFLRMFVLDYAYPRLDVKVTSGLNHLLKAPFSVHPKTGNIAVPLNSDAILSFDFNHVPRIDILSTEMARLKESAKENGKELYRYTSLAPYIEFFEQWIDGLLLV